MTALPWSSLDLMTQQTGNGANPLSRRLKAGHLASPRALGVVDSVFSISWDFAAWDSSPCSAKDLMTSL